MIRRMYTTTNGLYTCSSRAKLPSSARLHPESSGHERSPPRIISGTQAAGRSTSSTLHHYNCNKSVALENAKSFQNLKLTPSAVLSSSLPFLNKPYTSTLRCYCRHHHSVSHCRRSPIFLALNPYGIFDGTQYT